MIILKIAVIALCVLALVMTFRTENILRAVFRVENPGRDMILKTKAITLGITVILFIAVMLVFR